MKKGDAYYLATPEVEIMKLLVEATGKAIFWLNDEVYEVKRAGLWSSRYTICKSNKEVLSLSNNFWGGKGKIQFADGTHYISSYSYSCTMKLRFSDGDSEILQYGVSNEGGKQQVTLNVGIALIDADRLLILAALGMTLFLDMLNQIQDSDDTILIIAAAAS
jgi:hypothetical protein